MKVRLTPRAKRELDRVSTRWRKTRPAAPNLVLDEFEAATTHLSTVPHSGQLYGHRKGYAIRRWMLPKTQYGVYFTVDAKRDLLIIHSIWGARRGRGPKL
jgi:plasmid stabilization system protein ParE